MKNLGLAHTTINEETDLGGTMTNSVVGNTNKIKTKKNNNETPLSKKIKINNLKNL